MKRLVLLAALFVAVGVSCGDPETDLTASDSPATEAPDEAGENGAGGATLAGSCVEMYSLETLAKRDYAFDGTITSIKSGAADEGDTITFDVEEWFHGGEGATAERRGSGGGMTSAGGEARSEGDRLLVAGDDDFAWDCGFTQPYDASVAADWKAAFAD
jgi:hypothetical protein